MRPNHYAVVVGIDRYPGIPDKPLQHARNDAIAFYEWLTSANEGGVPGHNAKLIMATEFEQASKAKRPLRWEVIDFLTDIHQRVDEIDETEWSQSRLYIYLAGHGVAPDNGRGALLFADARPVYNWGDMLDLDVCGKFYERCRLFKEIILLGDFCRDVDGAIPAVSDLTFGKCYGESRSTRRVTGYATSLSEQSGEPEDAVEASPQIIPPPPEPKRAARGFFTRAVLEGLRGGAIPHPVSGVVDIGRLESYVRHRVHRLSGSFSQDVDITSSNAKDLILVRYDYDDVPRYLVDLMVPEDFPEPIELLLSGEDTLVMARWAPGDAPKWSVRLPAANYEAVALSESEEYKFDNDGVFKVRSDRVVRL